MSLKNAKTLPKIYYGLHMSEGVAEYKEKESSFRIMIAERAIKNMDPSFQGRPVYVRHVDEVDLENIQNEADGYVVESFFNPVDGKHWAKFIVVSDRGHEAIRNGWKLSNAYIPKTFGSGGLWHGVEFDKEVMSGEYEHLAIVPNPRYEESDILTPEEFKLYNSEKELELKRLANSKEENKGESSMKLNLFKRTKVENAADFEGMMVTLPKSGKEKTITQLVTEADEIEANKDKPKLANELDMVQVGEEKMSVKDVIAKLSECMKALAAQEGVENEESEESDPSLDNEEDDAAKKKVEEEQKKEKMKNEADEAAAKKAAAAKAKKEAFESLKNAPKTAMVPEATVDLSEDRVIRGKQRYGS